VPESTFDQLVRDLARGGSRRDFVRRSAGLAAVVGLARAGVPARFARPVATLLGVPAACETDSDCGDPCFVCGVRAAGEPKSCILKCQAQCTRCSGGQCIDQCPACMLCYPAASYAGSTCESVEILRRCETCDPKTGKHSTLCSACEKCDKGECVSNCPNRCEICDNGTCRKCDGLCETCDEASGKCTGCSSACERCNPTTKQCETTCPGGRACCEGQCQKCCGSCDRCLDPRGIGTDFCPTAKNDADLGCCATTGCVNLKEDRLNCGSCLHICKDTETCTDGRCVCLGVQETIGNIIAMRGGGQECTEENHECCDGDCVDVSRYQSDPKHCGKCIVECEKDEKCVKGVCVGSNRRGYSLVVVHRVTSSNLGVERSVTMKAVVRELDAPDDEGNTFAGKGSYDGWARRYNPSCDNQQRTKYETIPLTGEAKGSGNADDMGNGQISLVFTITPLNPPENLPEGVLPAFGNLVLTRGTGQESRTLKMQSDRCRGTLTHVTEWTAKRIR
jgi:hypothetical protein